MKLRVVMAIVVCILGAACPEKDTARIGKWRRSIEPWLTGMEWQARRNVPALKKPSGQCGTMVRTHADALRTLTGDLRCIDEAIEALKRLAITDAAAASDLAGTYYVRARAGEQPVDYLEALAWADEAVRRRPTPPAAQFNRALILEAMGLYGEALASYGSLSAESPWTTEARQRQAALRQRVANNALNQWRAHAQPQLEAALRAGDAATVASLVDRFPAAAQRHLEMDVLPRWARSGAENDLRQAEILASALTKRLRDDYFVDTIEAIRKGPTNDLRHGHLQFAEGRKLELAFKGDAKVFADSERAFARAGSPFRFAARLGRISEASDLPALDAVEQEVRTAGYKALSARIAWMRGWLNGSNPLEALEQYDEAIRRYEALSDAEGSLSVRVRHAGVLTHLGRPDLAWQALLRAFGEQHLIGVSKEFQTLAGESARAASALGYPQVALHYRQFAVDYARNELKQISPRDDVMRLHVGARLGTALSTLAEAEIETDRMAEAAAHLIDAERLPKPEDPGLWRTDEARFAEIRGQQLLQRTPRLAVAQFTRAIDLTQPASRSELARRYARRAAAQRNLGDRDAEALDLVRALEVLEAEEAGIVKQKSATGEPIWSGYFSRFEDVYALLIRHYADRGEHDVAFQYAERARGYEPLQRILRLPHVPAAFRPIAARRDVQGIRESLPPGTYILEYTVLEDETLTWILSRDRMRLIRQPATRADVEHWTRALQEAAAERDPQAFARNLTAPYRGLVARALSYIRDAHGNGVPRLVIVPDRMMQGLPFAALRDSRDAPYLIEEAILEFHGSALLYVFSLLRDGEMPDDGSMLLVGNPEFDGNLAFARDMNALPFAEQEVCAIDALHGGDPELLVREEATIGAFLELARRKAIVHVAAHAIVNTEAPYESVLLLAPTANVDRGALEAQELLRRAKLDRTRLVVLAACSSVGGAPVGPEGVGPLVRPLVTAGVPAVVGTLWSVHDATAREVLVSFHRHFQQPGSDAAVALREAQLKLLREEKSAMTWAPYQVIGHATSPYGAPVKKEEPP